MAHNHNLPLAPPSQPVPQSLRPSPQRFLRTSINPRARPPPLLALLPNQTLTVHQIAKLRLQDRLLASGVHGQGRIFLRVGEEEDLFPRLAGGGLEAVGKAVFRRLDGAAQGRGADQIRVQGGGWVVLAEGFAGFDPFFC